MCATSTFAAAVFAARRGGISSWEELPGLILVLTILGIIVAIAAYVLSKLRAGHKEEEVSPSKLMSLFGELYSDGRISADEYQAIKQRLAATLTSHIEAKAEMAAKGKVNGKANGKSKAKSSHRGAGVIDRDAELRRLLAAEELNAYRDET